MFQEPQALNGQNKRQEIEIRTPKVDVFETDQVYYLRLSLPGVRKENLHIEFDDSGDLVIKGKVVTELPKRLHKIILQEIFQGPFYRKISIPQSANKQTLKFGYDNGILEVFLDK
jgi:HSP20 family protein